MIMKKNYVFSGTTGYSLAGTNTRHQSIYPTLYPSNNRKRGTTKMKYETDKILCNKHSSYANWLRMEIEKALLRHQSIYPTLRHRSIYPSNIVR